MEKNSKKKCLFVFGTRPEAIKMAPVVHRFLQDKQMDTRVCVTAQHREMLDQVLDFFDIQPDYDLDLMQKGQSLFGLSARILTSLQPVLEDFKPDVVFVHGDTTTTMIGSMAAFYAGAKVGHVEAGLRTHDKYAPFPEEINRQITGRIADYNFAPTAKAKENLLQENVDAQSISVTGNTVIDALYWGMKKLKDYEDDEIQNLKNSLDFNKKIILVTGHRRENFGDGFINIRNALKTLSLQHPDVQIVYPVHLNPNVQTPIFEFLNEFPIFL